MAVITAQYMEYIDLMQALELELAGEYLLMAAMLAEIKSRMLLPRPESDDEEDDPRAELIRRLQEYEQIKTGAERLDELPRIERELFVAAASKPELVRQHADPDVDFREVLLAMAHVLRRAEMFTQHEVQLEPCRCVIAWAILNRVKASREFVPFKNFCRRGRPFGCGGDLLGHYGTGRDVVTGVSTSTSLCADSCACRYGGGTGWPDSRFRRY